MKISELEKILAFVREKHGDVEVLIEESGMGGYAMHTINVNDRINEMELSSLDENDDEDIKKQLFPSWDGTEETIDDVPSLKYFEIGMGTFLFAT